MSKWNMGLSPCIFYIHLGMLLLEVLCIFAITGVSLGLSVSVSTMSLIISGDGIIELRKEYKDNNGVSLMGFLSYEAGLHIL